MQKWVKKFGALLLTLLITLGFAVPTFAAQTDPVLSKIEKRGELIIGTSADYAPYEFHTTVNGKDKIVGFDMAVGRQIAKSLGVKLVIREMSFDALLGSVKTGKVDMVIAGMSSTPERAKEVTFSKPYFVDKNVVMTLKDDVNQFQTVAALKKAKLAAQMSSIQEDAAKELQGQQPVVSLKKINDMVTQLTQGKVDGIVVSQTTADSYMAQSNQFAVSKASLLSEPNGSSVVMAKTAPVLAAKVNHILANKVIGAPLDKWRQEATDLMTHKASFFQKYAPYFVKGTLYTVGLAIIGVFFGIILGVLLALMKLSSVKPLKWLAVVYIEAVRGVPLLIQVFIVYFGTQVIGLDVSSFIAGAIAMFLNSAAYVAEIIRSGIQAVPVGQTEAARSLGFTKMQTMRYMILPQAIKNILPALGNEFVTVIKEGSVVSVIGVGELTFQTSVVQGASFKPFIPLMITAVIYFILTFGLSRLLGRFEKKLQQSDRKII